LDHKTTTWNLFSLMEKVVKRYLSLTLSLLLLSSACSSDQTPTKELVPTITQIQERTPTPSAIPPIITPSVASKPISFIDSGQRLGSGHSWDVALGDLDDDGDLDIFVANSEQGELSNAVWLNDGYAHLTLSDQTLGFGQGVSMGDLDGDGDLDVLITNWWGQATNKILVNDGSGLFVDSGQNLGFAMDSALGDLNGDGDLDILLGQLNSNSIWLNDGNGLFSDSGQRLGNAITAGVALEDLDGDGDLDALTGGWDEPVKVWLNDGEGIFTEHRQYLSSASIHVHGLELGDLDGDGDMDTFIAVASGHPNQIWFNNGTGTFTDSGQPLQSPLAHAVSLGDIDNDGDIDAVTAHGARTGGSGGRIWLNDGMGSFSENDFRLGEIYNPGLALGDLDGDGDLDVFLRHGETWQEQGGGLPNEVWINEST
jgi:hypothetical protein